MIRFLESETLGWAVLIAVGLVTALLSMLIYRKREALRSLVQRWGGWRKVLDRAEIPVLGLMVVCCVMAVLEAVAPGAMCEIIGEGTTHMQIRRMSSLLAPLMGALLVARWIRSSALAIWAATLICFGGVAWNFFRGRADFLEMLALNGQGSSILTATYYVPTLSVAAIYLVIPILFLLVALGCYAVWPRWYSFVFGGAVIPTGIMVALGLGVLVPDYLDGSSTNQWQGPLQFGGGMLAVLATIWLLPAMREGVLRVAGLAEREEPSGPMRGMHLIGRCVFVGLTAAQLVLVFGIFLQVAQIGRLIAGRIERKPYSPALVNAWDVMQTNFDRLKSRQISSPESIYKTLLGPDGSEKSHRLAALDMDDLSEARELLTPEVRAALRQPPGELEPIAREFAIASRADYLSPHDGEVYRIPSYLNLRVAARWHGLRAVSETVEGDWRAALEHVGALYGYGSLELDGNLVSHMIQVAIRGIAQFAATTYWQAFHNDREAMAALAALLNETAPGNRRSFPVENLMRHEGFGQPVVVYADIMVPGYTRATTVYQREATCFDALRLATAAALFRLDRGDWPANLEELVPDYVPHIPADGFDGKPFIYEVQPGQLVLDTERSRAVPARNKSQADLTALPEFLLNAGSEP